MGTTTSSVDLMWSPSDDNIGVDHYDIYRETEGSMKKIATSNTTSYMDKNLLPNTTYKYVVKAVDVVEMNLYRVMYSQLLQKLKALHTKSGMQRKHMKKEIEFYTRKSI